MAHLFTELDIAIMEELQNYSDEVAGTVKDVIDEVTDEAVEKLKENSPRTQGAGIGGKHYYKGWAKKVEYNGRDSKRVRIYNKTKGQITMLLEFGHAKRNGKGRTSNIPHIKPVEKWVKDELPKRIEEALKNDG